MRAIWTKLSLLILALGALVLLYVLAVRPWMLNWGSTEAERIRPLPGDQIVAAPERMTTRALTIGVGVEAAYPWLAQLGQNRGGFYSYELLEDLAGCEMPRAETLLPGAQEWLPGDSLWMYPYDKLDGVGGAPLLASVPGRALAFGTWYPSSAHRLPPDGSWAFVLEPIDSSHSRFLVRSRGIATPGFGAWLFDRAVFEPMHFVMERRMMEGIQSLAESRTPRSRLADAAEILVWAGMVVLFSWGIVATLRRERWLPPLAVTVVAAIGYLFATLFQPAAWVGLPLVAILAWVLRRGARDSGDAIAGTNEALAPAVAQ